jgi:cytochrome c-type biogenesis protein CcmH
MRGLSAGESLRPVCSSGLRVFTLAGFLTVALILLLAAPALSESGLTPEQEKQARALEGKLIAPCCWTQPVSDHQSEASDQIKAEIRMLVAQGSSDKEILDTFIVRYGEKILAAPAPRGFNLTAYVLPALALLVAAAIVFLMAMRWRRDPAEAVPAVAPGPSDPERTAWEQRLREDLKGFDD